MKLKVYMASGWFTKRTDEILTNLENILRNDEHVVPYFPRHDGVKLSANEFHDHKLREKVFLDNVSHIDDSDFILANLDCYDPVIDTGTIWEVGRAMAKGIPVIAFDMTGTLQDRLPALYHGFNTVLDSYSGVSEFFSNMIDSVKSQKVLFLGPESTEEQKSNTLSVVSTLVEVYGKRLRWVDNLSHTGISTKIDDIFSNVELMIAVIDDRDPVVSWMMGQAYSRGIPIISYTNYDYGVNLMLGLSVLSHCKGIDELKEKLNFIRRNGIDALDSFDTTNLKMY